ncbi:LuxR C-terminal-related transcriptional regulator [Mesobacterium pallidum]|uniref:LuxR C-terminal-related transcriptional regulator n=1 Tax=Mesobacterium pallidum TaxID=2872037 RepID=UPI001EE1E5A4|nr:LuxR C-terminal-related transcriptional regulator [Mesobacterium pallidum]
MAFARTALQPTRQKSGFVRRDRLNAYLDSVLAHRMTLVHAPAGAGKSVLLSQWRNVLIGRLMPVAWLSLDRHSGNHLGQLMNSLAECAPSLAEDMRQRLATGLSEEQGFRTSETELTALVDCLVAHGDPVCIMMDDAQFVPLGESALFRRFVQRLPGNVCLVLSTRNRPDLPLARMRALGELFELNESHLRFTVAETTELLTLSGQAGLSAEDAEHLVRRTEGWATGLRLAVLSMSGQTDGARLIASFSGSKRVVSDFFSEDVVSALPQEMQEFLLSACFLDRFSAELCEQVTGQADCAKMINRVEAAGLFLVRLDDDGQWFRFQSLFAEFLCRRAIALDPEAVARVHREAALWCLANGKATEALDYAERSGDMELLAELLEQCCEAVVYDGKLYHVADLAKLLGPALLNTCPAVLLCVAWMEIRGLKFELAQKAIDQAEALIDARGDAPDAPIRSIVMHRKMMLAASLDDFPLVESYVTQLLAHKDHLHPYLVCNLYGQSIRAQRGRLRYEEFERNEALARRALTDSNYKFAFVAQQAIVGRTYFAQGRSVAAERALHFGLEQAVDFAGEGSALAALPALPYASLLYDRNELGKARAMLESHLPNSRLFCFSDELLDGLTLAPRLKSASGDIDGALQALDEAQSIAHELELPRLMEGVRAERVAILLRHYFADRALMLETDPHVETLAFKPTSTSTVVDETRAVTRVRLDMASGKLDDATALAQRWRSFAQGRGGMRSLVRWSLLHAQLSIMQGDRRVAQRSLRDALVAACESRSIRPFIDEGVRVHDLLADSYGSGPRTDQPVDMFAYDLLDLFKGSGRHRIADVEEDDEEPAIDGKMTGRELEILTFVAAGLRNREIGDRLGLTEGSVKWYMQRIYDKVGTRRRSLAVERARQFGFLH